ncbi:MAG: type II secretion system protein GspC, partial [Polyangiales bacterium]
GATWLPFEPAAILLRTDVASASTLPPHPPAKNASAKAILAKNPFDSVTGPILDPGDVPITEGGVVQAAPGVCASALRLVVAAVDDDPARSMAVLSNGTNGKPMVHTGSMVDGRKVLGIGAQRVYLREGESYCWIGTTMPAAAPPKPMPTTGVTITPNAPPVAVAVTGVERIDDTHYAVDRLLRDKILESPTEFMKTLQIAPEVSAGKTVGIKLLRVLPGSLFGVLGLKPGDVVHTINGFEVGSPEKMLEAYAKLRTAPQLQVGVVREGKPLAVEVEVR